MLCRQQQQQQQPGASASCEHSEAALLHGKTCNAFAVQSKGNQILRDHKEAIMIEVNEMGSNTTSARGAAVTGTRPMRTACTAVRLATAVITAATERRAMLVLSAGVETALRCRLDGQLTAALNSADFVCASDRTVMLTMGAVTPRLVRTTPMQLAAAVLDEARRARQSIALVGSDPGLLARAALALALDDEYGEVAGGLDIAGTFALQGNVADAAGTNLVEEVAASGARICLIGLDTPREQVLAHAFLVRQVPLAVVGIGRALTKIARSYGRGADR